MQTQTHRRTNDDTDSDMETDSFITVSSANWEKVKGLVQGELCSIVQASAIELVAVVQEELASPISTADMNYMKVSNIGLTHSNKNEMSAQELALMCTAVGTAIYCEEGNLHSNRSPCVYVPIVNSTHDNKKIHKDYVFCCAFNSIEDMRNFQYEVPPALEEGPIDNAVSGLGHNLIMEASYNIYTWLSYQHCIMKLEHSRLNMNDMA